MSNFATEYNRVKTNIENAYTECQNKGATMPINQNSDNLANTIASITSGGGELTFVNSVVQNFGRYPTTSSISYTTTDDYTTLYIICAGSSGDNAATAQSGTITLTASKTCTITKLNEVSHFSQQGSGYSNACRIAFYKIENVESGTVFTMSSYQQFSVSKSMQIFSM